MLNSLKNGKEQILYCLKAVRIRDKLNYSWLEATVGINSLRAMIFHFNLEASYSFKFCAVTNIPSPFGLVCMNLPKNS